MKTTLVYFTIFLLTFNLSFAQNKDEKKKSKEETAKKEYERTKSLIEAGTYFFTAEWTTTQKGKNINLATNFGYLKIDKENITGLIQQKPNKKLFGLVRFKLWVYNIANKGKETKFKKSIS